MPKSSGCVQCELYSECCLVGRFFCLEWIDTRGIVVAVPFIMRQHSEA